MEKDSRRLGPAPMRSGAPGRALSGQRSTVLEHLQQGSAPVTVAVLAKALGLHANTVREHLDALVDAGLAERERATSTGRGRPPWEYTAADVVEHDVRLRDYAGLTRALAAHLERTSADPAGEAQEIGRDWGRQLAASSPLASHGPAAARAQTLVVLDGLGFAPDSDPASTTAALRRCPLLDVARAFPAVVCNVHLGIVRGTLEAYGGEPEPAALLAFSEPGACRLHLVAPDAGTTPGFTDASPRS